MQDCTKLFGTKKTWFGVAGSASNIIAAMRIAFGKNSDVVI